MPNGPSGNSVGTGGSKRTPSRVSTGAGPGNASIATGPQTPPYVPGTSTTTASLGRTRGPEPLVIRTVSIYDSPAVPDKEGNSVIMGLLTGKGLTAIEPNLRVCVREAGAARPTPICTDICKRGHICINQGFSKEVKLNPANPKLTVIVLNQDQTGVNRNILTFVEDPTKCTSTNHCKEKVTDTERYGNNAVVEIAFGNGECQCLNPNDPVNGTWRPDSVNGNVLTGLGQQLTTNYAQVWTHFCAGKTLDGILFKLFGGQAAPKNPNITPATDCRPEQSHIIQFVNTSLCDEDGTCPGTQLGTYQGRYGPREIGTQWYLDTGGGAQSPYLGPEVFPSEGPSMGAHLVDDEPSVDLQVTSTSRRLMQKNFVDFVMCGSEIKGTIKWTRTGVNPGAPPSACGARTRSSSYDVAELQPRDRQTIRPQICAAINDSKQGDAAFAEFKRGFCGTQWQK